jgi:hypothetical protein
MTSESKVMAWDRYKIMVGLNQLMASDISVIVFKLKYQ